MQIQVIHCEQKLPPRTISSQPDTKVINETIEPPQISITLGVTPMEGKCLICPLVTGYGHQQINAVRSINVFTRCIASLLPRDLPKFTVLILDFELALIQINYILSTLPKHSVWKWGIAVEVANMHVQRQVRSIRHGGCRLPCQTKPMLRPNNL
jgi:hypothetical protein